MRKTVRKVSFSLAVLMIMMLVCVMSINVSATTDTITNEYTGYYKIGNPGQLAWFACLVVGDTSQSSITEAVPNAKAVLTADIDVSILATSFNKSWSGIGTANIPFTGILDGNGYTITGLTIDTSLANSCVATIPNTTVEQGLVGVLGEGGIIRNLVVEGTAKVSENQKLGAICSVNNGTIENVLAKVTVEGGITPNAICHTNNGTIRNCYTTQSGTTLATLVDTDTLASGSVTYALGTKFGQTLGTNLQPIHNDGTNTVYRVYECDGETAAYRNVNENHPHSTSAQGDRAASCTQKAYCSVCEKEYGEIDENAHSWNSGVVTTNPTCMEKGVKTYTCTHNSAHTYIEDVAINENAHAWNEGEVTTEPTCSAVGAKTFTCTHNSAHTKTEDVAIDTNAHAWNEGAVTTDPTCTEKGVKTYTCTHNSAHTKTEDVNALGHAYDNACDITCNTCGEERTPSDHVDADENDTCDVCGAEIPKDGLSGGAIVGIVIGSVIALGGGGFALFWFVIRKKRRI